MKKNRICVDTSVMGAVGDEEFKALTEQFLDEVREGKHLLLISDITARELQGAPQRERSVIAGLPLDAVESLEFTLEMAELRDAYIEAGVLTPKWMDDAAYVAAATVARADLIVSWNFKHLVKWNKIRAFNAVNLKLGYPLMTILSPREVIGNEEEV